MYSTRVVELHPTESEALLTFLRVSITDPTFACRYRWADGTFAMWDNRCTMHRVSSDFVGERIIHRVTVAGDAPVRA
jgi:taurine dioxygenase